MLSSVTPRIATLNDVAELVRVINLAYRVEDFFINGNRTHGDDVRARMEKPGASFLAIDGAPGLLGAAAYLEIRGDRGYFAMLSVDPAFQKQGLGARLIADIERRCRDAGCQALDIEVVNLRAELPAFYERFGFRATGVAEFPDPGKLSRAAHLTLMSKPL